METPDGSGSKLKTQGATDSSICLVFSIKVLGYPSLTHTHIDVKTVEYHNNQQNHEHLRYHDHIVSAVMLNYMCVSMCIYIYIFIHVYSFIYLYHMYIQYTVIVMLRPMILSSRSILIAIVIFESSCIRYMFRYAILQVELNHVSHNLVRSEMGGYTTITTLMRKKMVHPLVNYHGKAPFFYG